MRDYQNEALLQKTVTLPSKGKLYNGINPEVTLRGMTIRDEIIRLNASENEFKPLADVLDRCIISDLGMSAYDLCLGDFQFLLFQLRAITYGNTMTLETRCPYCGSFNHYDIAIDEIPLVRYTMDEIMDTANLELPITKERITLNPMTPRLLDKMKSEAKKAKKHTKAHEADLFIKLSACIASIEDVDEEFDIDDWLEKLPMMDINTILQYSNKLDTMIGLDLSTVLTCDTCGLDFESSITIGKDFFRPRVIE